MHAARMQQLEACLQPGISLGRVPVQLALVLPLRSGRAAGCAVDQGISLPAQAVPSFR